MAQEADVAAQLALRAVAGAADAAVRRRSRRDENRSRSIARPPSSSGFVTMLFVMLAAAALLAGAFDPRVLEAEDLAPSGLGLLGRFPPAAGRVAERGGRGARTTCIVVSDDRRDVPPRAPLGADGPGAQGPARALDWRHRAGDRPRRHRGVDAVDRPPLSLGGGGRLRSRRADVDRGQCRRRLAARDQRAAARHADLAPALREDHQRSSISIAGSPSATAWARRSTR